MITINENYLKLSKSYLFSQISSIVDQTKEKNPNLDVIRLGIGDVTKALCPAVIEAFHQGVDEMEKDDTFKGYGPEQGYEFLRRAIAEHDFKQRNIDISPDEVIVSDGSKCDAGNFQEIFSSDAIVAVPDPIYPVYVDTNVMAGRTGAFQDGHYDKIVYLVANEDNGFVPVIPNDAKVDLIYLCFPNNPTGVTPTKEQLKSYVDYALTHDALILFDAAYCAYIREEGIPRSIFEIEGAKECAVEFRSFSKTAGFTGTRCAFTIIPNECRVFTSNKEKVSVRDLWIRRHTTKFNGVSYPVQKAASAIYTPEGKSQIQETIDYYMNNAKIITHTMEKVGFKTYGGENAPFIWTKANKPSWDFFQELLAKTGVVTTPGAGFGPSGEGYIRISAFNHIEKVELAMDRITKFL